MTMSGALKLRDDSRMFYRRLAQNFYVNFLRRILLNQMRPFNILLTVRCWIEGGRNGHNFDENS